MTTYRQRYALAHPLNRADIDPMSLAPLKFDRQHKTGLLLRSLLAVDR